MPVLLSAAPDSCRCLPGSLTCGTRVPECGTVRATVIEHDNESCSSSSGQGVQVKQTAGICLPFIHPVSLVVSIHSRAGNIPHPLDGLGNFDQQRLASQQHLHRSRCCFSVALQLDMLWTDSHVVCKQLALW